MASQSHSALQTERAEQLPATARRMWQLDLRSIAGAAAAVLLLRIVLGLWVLPTSAANPGWPLEAQVPVLPSGQPDASWLQRVGVLPWLRYDAISYERIVRHGYQLEDNTAGFHPLYPLLAAALTPLLGGNIVLALLVVSTLSSLALCVLFTRYVARFHSAALAQPAGWLLLLAPPSFVLLAPYTESTFMALAVAAIWALRRERWWLAGLLGGLAALTRQQGLALALPLAWALWVALRANRARYRHLAAVALVPLGYGLFVAYRAVFVGDFAALREADGPVEFLHRLMVSNAGREVVAGQRIAWPWELLIDQLRLIAAATQRHHLLLDLLLGWAGVALALLGMRELHATERLYVLGILALALCYYIGDINPYMALPRHVMIAFPLFITLGRCIGRGPQRWLVAALLLVNLALATLFVQIAWIP
jgi:hypothetical protein